MKNYSIYLDSSATTPIDIDVINRMREIDKHFWGNPSSLHSEGIRAAEVLEKSRCQIGKSLKAMSEEIITV